MDVNRQAIGYVVAEGGYCGVVVGFAPFAEDIGQAAVYLSQASYVTGVVLPVDGGYLTQ